MMACAVEATKKVKIMAGDELLCHIPKMTDVEPVIQPFYIRGGVSLDHLQHGHIDFDLACSTCNMMQIRHSQHRRQLEPHCLGQLSGDLAGLLFEEKYFSVRVKRNTRMEFVACMKNKRSKTVKRSTNSRSTCAESGDSTRTVVS